jgi:hypothetical protein
MFSPFDRQGLCNSPFFTIAIFTMIMKALTMPFYPVLSHNKDKRKTGTADGQRSSIQTGDQNKTVKNKMRGRFYETESPGNPESRTMDI